ncbi:response regulator transcription factor [Rhodococcus sp. MS16]|uniref:response regulator n=1 Tax=Rhodococcus TaxID=1827 RepID=UPI000E21D028|nr:response regulator transcription factor [Rhodococcus globerulus]MCE4266918.1 response regulator transcription factor [Rhodococcus globerulus]NRI65990.1 response regulator transcription factor [Rhodococcus sp. MS16]
MIAVLVVDDQRLVRAGLRMLCTAAEDMTVSGEASNGVEAVALAAELDPDVILMDLRMPGLDGIGATRQIVKSGRRARILVLTTFDDDDHLYPALAAGASGFLVKDTEPAELLGAIRRTAEGDMVFSPELLRRVVDRAVIGTAAGTAVTEAVSLTERESQVLALVAEGKSNQEIADALHLGVTTVKTHVANLMSKTGCDNRVRLAVYYLQNFQ